MDDDDDDDGYVAQHSMAWYVIYAILRQHTSRLGVLHDGIRSSYGLLYKPNRVSYIFGTFSLECTRKSVNEACGNVTEPIRAPHIYSLTRHTHTQITRAQEFNQIRWIISS